MWRRRALRRARLPACSPAQALIDSPEITRTIINFKRLLLTDLSVEIGKVPNKKALAEALKTAGAHLHLLGWGCTRREGWRSRALAAARTVRSARRTLLTLFSCPDALSLPCAPRCCRQVRCQQLGQEAGTPEREEER